MAESLNCVARELVSGVPANKRAPEENSRFVHSVEHLAGVYCLPGDQEREEDLGQKPVLAGEASGEEDSMDLAQMLCSRAAVEQGAEPLSRPWRRRQLSLSRSSGRLPRLRERRAWRDSSAGSDRSLTPSLEVKTSRRHLLHGGAF